MRARFAGTGHLCVDIPRSPAQEIPDIIVVNSCAVTAESERKTRQKLRHLRARYPRCILILTGCAAQISKDPDSDYQEADIVLGHRDIDDLSLYLNEYLLHRDKLFSVSPHCSDEVLCRGDLSCESSSRTRAFLKIEDGCDQYCSYCIVPHARGHVRSKPLSAIRQEIETLSYQGFLEVVLVGINLAAYGSDLGCSLCDAVALFDEFSVIKRLRLGSLEPLCLTDHILETLFLSKSLCPHFHISLQSGSDSVLNRMNRDYDTAQYFSTVKHIRERFPDCAITTDLIVGFPGESDAEFEESIAFAREISFAKVHVFPFSAREGTSAATFPNQISKAIKQARTKTMLSLANEMKHDFMISQLGKTCDVLLEEPHPSGGMTGFTSNYTHVIVRDAALNLRNHIIPVRITDVKDEYCYGALSR